MARRKTPHLTESEQRIMNVLWESGESTVKDVTNALQKEFGLAYTTVLTTIGIMKDKGYVEARKVGRAFIYRPIISRSDAQSKATGNLVTSMFAGSPQRLAQHLVDNHDLSLDDIEALREAILQSERRK